MDATVVFAVVKIVSRHGLNLLAFFGWWCTCMWGTASGALGGRWQYRLRTVCALAGGVLNSRIASSLVAPPSARDAVCGGRNEKVTVFRVLVEGAAGTTEGTRW